MQSCWVVDPTARPDMFKIQLAMRDILSRVKPPSTAIARCPNTSPVRVSPTIDGGPAQETNGSSSESQSSSPPPSGGQLTLESSPSSSPTTTSPRLKPLSEQEKTWMLYGGSTFPALLGSVRRPPIREDDYEPEPHIAGISIPTSLPTSVHSMVSPESSLRHSTASILSSQPTLASDFLGRTSLTSSDSQSDIFSIRELDDTESIPPNRKLSWRISKRTQSPSKPNPTPQVRLQTNPVERLREVPSQSSTVLPIITTTRQRALASEDVLRFLKKVASDPEPLLRPARDGSVSTGNLEGLLFRAIVGSSDPSRDERFKTAFLTIYQLFATSEQVFEILKRRFEATSVDPSSRFL